METKWMDTNVIVLRGSLSAAPELREFDSGTRLFRLLVTVRSDEPRKRVDVIPVAMWDPPAELIAGDAQRGDRVRVTGAVQRRFWDADQARKSRIEVVAEQVSLLRGHEDDGDQ